MIFSRDAVQEKLRTLNESAAERNRAFLAAAYLSCALSFALFFAVLFTSGHWGGAASFQAMSTAILAFCLGVAGVDWMNSPNMQRVDFIGGAFVVTTLMLLQTALLWGNFSSGFGRNYGPICIIRGNGGDQAVSVISYILFFLNLFVGLAAFRFRSDWTEASGSSYITINPPPPGGLIPSVEVKSSNRNTAQPFDDVEGGL